MCPALQSLQAVPAGRRAPQGLGGGAVPSSPPADSRSPGARRARKVRLGRSRVTPEEKVVLGKGSEEQRERLK
jgi:hypothetical protein